MTPLSEDYRRKNFTSEMNMWSRAKKAIEVEGDVSTSDSDLENAGAERQIHPEEPALRAHDSYEDKELDKDGESPVVAEPRREVEVKEGNNIHERQVANNFFPFPLTRTPAQFHTISSNAPVLNITPSVSSSTSRSSPAARNTTSRKALRPAVSTVATPIIPSSTTLPLPSTTPQQPFLPSVTSLPTTVSDSSTEASSAPTQSTTEAAVARGVNGGQVAGATVGGVAGIAIIATAVFFFKKRRRGATEIISPTPTRKESIRVVRTVPAAARASDPLTPSAFKFNFGAPRLPRDQWPQSMEILDSRVRAEYAAIQQGRDQGPKGYGAREPSQGSGYYERGVGQAQEYPVDRRLGEAVEYPESRESGPGQDY